MSCKVMFALVLAMAAVVSSAPPKYEEPIEVLPSEYELSDVNVVEDLQNFLEEALTVEEAEARQARVTCDLLSGIGWNHTFCAAHCIFKGYKGGACNSKGVCVCRR
ncbi:arthropod defensin domain-containing protein [Phthorimaea operculella]|nr:arthropod defensin domain-containing protein [Phthorimaea operculella]